MKGHLALGGIHGLLCGGKGRVKAVLSLGEVQNTSHLLLRVAPSPGIGHGQDRGEAVGSKEDVPLLFRQLGVEIQGESGVALGQGRDHL